MALTAGVLSLTIEFANNLKDLNFFARMDPYCIIRIGTQTFRSKTAVRGGCNPVWNQTFRFNLVNENDAEIKLKDENAGQDGDIGSAVFSLARAREAGSDRIHVPVLIERSRKQHGFICVSLRWAANLAPSTGQVVPPMYPLAPPQPTAPPLPSPLPPPPPPPPVVYAPAPQPAPLPPAPVTYVSAAPPPPPQVTYVQAPAPPPRVVVVPPTPPPPRVCFGSTVEVVEVCDSPRRHHHRDHCRKEDGFFFGIGTGGVEFGFEHHSRHHHHHHHRHHHHRHHHHH